MSHHEVDIHSLPSEALIRLLADDELSGEERAAAEAKLREAGVDIDARVRFERELRASTARALRDPTTPMDLRERIEQTLQSDPAYGAGTIRTPDGDTKSPRFWRHASRFAALAAVLALAGVLVFRGSLFSSRPFSQQFQAQLISFVQTSHEECEECPTRSERLPESTIEGGLSLTKRTLGSFPPGLEESIRTLSEKGYTFIGMGACETPSNPVAVHIMFEYPDSGSLLSFFVESDNGFISADPHCCYVKDCSDLGHRLAVWRNDGFVFYTYGDDNTVVQHARESFDAPSDLRNL